MSDRQVERELSELFCLQVDGSDFEALAEKVWRRNRRYSSFLNCAIVGSAILGCALSLLVIGSYELAPAAVRNLNVYQSLIGGHWIAALGVPMALLASLWASKLASD